MNSKDLTPSPTWRSLSSAIDRQYKAGVPFSDIHEMNVVIKQRDLTAYAAHRVTLDTFLWPKREPKTIFDFGAGYGAMAGFWPAGARVFNIDLPEMLDIQASYIPTVGVDHVVDITLVPYNEADGLPWDGAYLFAAYSLTETDRATWDYYMAKAPRLAGAYIVGMKQWERHDWPWLEMAQCFKTTRLFRDTDDSNFELCTVNI